MGGGGGGSHTSIISMMLPTESTEEPSLVVRVPLLTAVSCRCRVQGDP